MSLENDSEYAAFLRAVIARPDDDLPRLIMADWLDEHWSAERAEFIRVQCELAKGWQCADPGIICAHTIDPVECESCDNWREALRRRERELLDRHTQKWLDDVWHCDMGVVGPVTDWNFTPPRRYDGGWCAGNEPTPTIMADFHRGFAEELACSWSDCLAHLSAIRERTPVRRVRLTDRPQLTSMSNWHDAEQFELNGWPGIEFELPPRQHQVNWPHSMVISSPRRHFVARAD